MNYIEKIIEVLPLAVFAGAFTVVMWRWTALFTLYWVVLVGAVRKWLLPDFADVLFFSTPLLLLGVYLRALLFEKSVKGFGLVLSFMIVMLLMWGLVGIINPRSPNLFVGIIGYVTHFIYLPLCFVVPKLFNSKQNFIIHLKRYLFFSIPILILGLFQYVSPQSAFVNKYVGDDFGSIALVGNYVRITGTFSYITGYTIYLNVVGMIALYFVSLSSLVITTKLITTAVLVLTIINMFMTGSRGVVGSGVITLILFSVLISIVGSRRVLTYIFKVVLIMAAILITLNYSTLSKKAQDSFMKRWHDGRAELSLRIADTFTPMKFAKKSGLLGYGIGSTYQGFSKLDYDWGDMTLDFEEEPERVVLELGVIGYLLHYGLRLMLILYGCRLFLSVRDKDLKTIMLISVLFQLPTLHISGIIFNTTSGYFYWFFVGVMLMVQRFHTRQEGHEKRATCNSLA